MSKFVIQSHGRLQEWVAVEKGYFEDEGLDYALSKVIAAGKANPARKAAETPEGIKHGAYESYEAGRDASVSCACHWTVNMAASADHGLLWGECYSVTPSGLFVPPDSKIRRPEDLADVEVSVGYHSGSHYSTIQGLEPFLKPEQIKLRFGGLPVDRVDQLLAGEVKAANAFGAPYYLLEQLGFRKILDTTFMIAGMITKSANHEDVRKYYRALRRAQADIDVMHQPYTHYYLNELPERFHSMVDVRRFGPGERLVFEPYTKEIYERTHEWVEVRNIFPEDKVGHGAYEDVVVAAE